jgi:hypothetical protein
MQKGKKIKPKRCVRRNFWHIAGREKSIIWQGDYACGPTYKGGAMNHGLLFAGLPLSPLGGCERKD